MTLKGIIPVCHMLELLCYWALWAPFTEVGRKLNNKDNALSTRGCRTGCDPYTHSLACHGLTQHNRSCFVGETCENIFLLFFIFSPWTLLNNLNRLQFDGSHCGWPVYKVDFLGWLGSWEENAWLLARLTLTKPSLNWAGFFSPWAELMHKFFASKS